jgi:hypothetical protein
VKDDGPTLGKLAWCLLVFWFSLFGGPDQLCKDVSRFVSCPLSHERCVSLYVANIAVCFCSPPTLRDRGFGPHFHSSGLLDSTSGIPSIQILRLDGALGSETISG